MIKYIRIISLTLLMTSGMVSGAAAQDQMPGRRGGPPYGGMDDRTDRSAPPSEEKRDEIRKKMEAVRIWRLAEELKLDEKTSAKFLPLLGAIEQRRREIIKQEMEAMQELRGALDSRGMDEKRLKAALDRLEKGQREMAEIRERELKAAKDNLTIEQQARYIIFVQEFQREMLGMINRARDGGQNPGGGEGMRGGQGRPGPGGPMTDGRPEGGNQFYPRR